MLLYKGAGPGTHWSIHDPAKAGGFPTARGVANLHSLVRHIVNYSWPSQHTSFSASYAVACDYALLGLSGRATKAAPGVVYEIDTTLAPGLVLVDPAREILKGNPKLPRYQQTHHDGGQNLIIGIAGGIPTVLAATPRRPTPPSVPAGPESGTGGPPVVNLALRALVFAIRDAEVLARRRVPRTCIVNRYLVY